MSAKAFCCRKSSRMILGGLQGQLVTGGQGVLTDQLDDLVQAGFFLEDGHSLVAVLEELLAQVFIVPGAERIQVEGVGVQPVDGREVTAGKPGRRPGPRRP